MSLRYLSPDAQLLPSEVERHTQFLTHGPPFTSRHHKAVSLAHPPTRPVPQTSTPGSLHCIPLAHARSPGLPEQHAPPQLSHTCLTQCRITETTPRFYSTSKSVSLVLRLKNQRPRQPGGFGQPRADRPLGSRSSLLTGTPQWVPLQGPKHRTPLSALPRMDIGAAGVCRRPLRSGLSEGGATEPEIKCQSISRTFFSKTQCGAGESF